MTSMTMPTRRGFTLIELLITVIIISVLASIVMGRFTQVRERAFVTTLKSDLKNLATQQEIYHNSSYSFTASLASLEMVPSDGVSITITEADGVGWAATAVHAGLTAEQCGLYHGSANPANGSPGAAQGVVGCTSY